MGSLRDNILQYIMGEIIKNYFMIKTVIHFLLQITHIFFNPIIFQYDN